MWVMFEISRLRGWCSRFSQASGRMVEFILLKGGYLVLDLLVKEEGWGWIFSCLGLGNIQHYP